MLPVLFEAEYLERELEVIASENEGVVPEDKFQELIAAQTNDVEHVGRVLGFIMYRRGYIATGEAEIERIQKLLKVAKNQLNSVSKYITPYAEAQRERLGRPMDVGLYKLSVRHNSKVEFTDPNFAENFPAECIKKVTYTPSAEKVRAWIEKNHKQHPGAIIVDRVNLNLK